MRRPIQLRILALTLTLASMAFAHSPMPTGLKGFLTQSAITTEKQCDDDADPKCEKRTYTITINVNEKFVRLPLSQQTPKVLAFAKWYAEDFATKPEVTITIFAALNGKVIGWAEGTGWDWDREYVDAINRRALRRP